jgi:hypothetical protein
MLPRLPPSGYWPDDPRLTWNLTPSVSDEDQRSGGYEPHELICQLDLLNLREFWWCWPDHNLGTHNKTEAQMPRFSL